MKKCIFLVAVNLFTTLAFAQNEFITTWQTTIANESITIPTTGSGYNYNIDWDNDGIFDDFNLTGNATHIYAAPGTHTVSITGTFPRIYFNNSGDKDKILSVEQWGTQLWENLEFSFRGCSNLVINATDAPDLTVTASMRFMFSNCTSFNQSINHWDISSVPDIRAMFDGASSFNQDLSAWDVGHITNLAGMFSGATAFNQDLSSWDVSGVVNLSGMFSNATAFNQDIGNWDVSSADQMPSMFRGSGTFNQDLSNWDVSNVILMQNMFDGAASFDQNIANWDISSVVILTNMFANAGLSAVNYDALLTGWSTLQVGETLIPQNISFNGGNSTYCNGLPGKNRLISNYNWTITDDGLNSNCDDYYFKTTWKTTVANESITIPTTGSGYDYDIDWDNDGVFDVFNISGNASHTYPNLGNHTVVIRGSFPRIHFFNDINNASKIQSVDQWGNISWTSMERAFWGCSNLILTAVDKPDLSNVTSMLGIFAYCAAFNQDINDWDVSNVTNMTGSFNLATSFNQNLNNWDVSSVTQMGLMFNSASSFNQDLSNWDVSNVTNMALMFSFAESFNQPIGSWNTSNVSNMSSMFSNANSFNQNLGTWDISSLTNASFMFNSITLHYQYYDALLEGWSTLDTGETQIPTNLTFDAGNSTYCLGENARANLITNFGWTINDDGFYDCTNFIPFITTWQTTTADESIVIPIIGGNFEVDWDNDGIYDDFGMCGSLTHIYETPGIHTVAIRGIIPQINFFSGGSKNKILGVEQWGNTSWTTMSVAFYECTNLVINATDTPDLSNVTSMVSMFQDATSVNQNLENWDVGNVTNMSGLFNGATAFNGDIGGWDVNNVTSMLQMFFNAHSFNQNIGGWDTQNISNMTQMFRNAYSFNQDIDGWDTSQLNNVEGMFFNALAFNQDLNSWNVSNINSMNTMFNGAVTFNGDISSWNVGNVTTMVRMFQSAEDFNQDISNWNVSNVNNISSMFRDAFSFNIDIGNWNIGNVTDLSVTFAGASSFNQDIGDWNTENVIFMIGTFDGATNFNQDISGWDVSKVEIMRFMFQGADSFNQDISGWEVSSVIEMEAMFQNATSFNQNLGAWDISQIQPIGPSFSMFEMFLGTALSTQNYDNTLIGWSTLDAGETQIPTNVTFNGGTSTYCLSEQARTNLINNYSWIITDGGANCGSCLDIARYATSGWLGTPNSNSIVVIETDYNANVLGAFQACRLIVNEGVSLDVGGETITVKGDVANNGTISATSGTLVLNGDEAQLLSGNGFHVGDLVIENSSLNGVILQNNIEIINRLDLINGPLDTTSGGLTFNSDTNKTAMLDIVGSGIVIGEVTVERFIPAGDNNRRAFRFLTSSLNSQSSINANWQEGATTEDTTPNPNSGYGTHITGGSASLGFDQNGSGTASVFTFDNTNQNATATQDDDWYALPNTNTKTLKAGEAYLTFIRGDRSIDVTSNSATPTNTTLRASGDLHVGSISFSSANNSTTPEYGLSDQADFYSLVGNPYQAIVDINNLDFTNVKSNFYWVWDANLGSQGQYTTVSLPSGLNNTTSSANQFVQPSQSFFVQTIADGSASLTFNEDDKNTSGGATTIFSDQNEPSIHLLLYTTNALSTGAKESDGTLINFSENANNGLDLFDADKFLGPGENLARLHGNELISIENRAMPTDNEVLALSTTGYAEDNYTFVVNASNIQSNFEAYLLDNYTGTQIQLNEGATQINFIVDANIPASSASDRFSLIFDNTTLGVNENRFGADFSLYPNPTRDGRFSIKTNGLSGEDVNIKIYNILGQQVLRQNLKVENNGDVNVEASGLSSGVYLVELTQNEKSFSTKLIVE